jgi:hypothetical protein
MATMTITNNIWKWFQNKTSWTRMIWWKISFNMPVKNIFDNGSTYTETEWMLNTLNSSTSYDLSGFQLWWEICACNSVFTIYWPYAWWTVTLRQVWKNPAWTNYFINWDYNISFPALSSWYWSSYQLASNTWCASWEVWVDGTYQVYWIAVGWWFSQNTPTNITITNCPSINTYTPWMLWIEWAELKWISANWHLHSITGTSVANVGTSYNWALWIDWTNVYWVGNWYEYYANYTFRQFASAFSNWPSPWIVSWQTPWFFWMDSNFGYEHIWYIASDGYKYILPSWENAYA